VLLKIF